MAVRFSAKGWTRSLEAFVRQAHSLHLRTAGGEVADRNYSPNLMIGASWEMGQRGPIVTAAYPPVLWRFAAPQPVTGYEVRDADGEVLWEEDYPGAALPIDLHELTPVIEIDIEG